MFNKGRYAYDRVQLEEVSSEEEYRPASPVVRSPPHPFPERKKHAVRTQQPPMRCCCLNELCVKCLYLFVVGLVMLAGFLIILNIIKHNSSSGGNSNVGSDRKPVIQVINDTNSGISSDFPVCSKLEVHQVWVQNFPQLLTETAVRLVDVNKDGILDAILGFATGAGSPFADPDLVCRIYFDGQVPCFGGVLALDGITGNEIWRHWSEQEVFALNCNADITGDGVSDCVCSGRMGMFELISGSDGVRLWVFDNHASKVSISNFYTAQFLHDIDGDDVQDILTVHGGDPLRKPGANVSYAGRVMLFSGATGQLITWSKVPDGMESYYSPQVYYNSQGEEVVLFGTGGETHGGSLWIIKLQDVINGKIQEARCLYKDVYKGVMTPPVLLDLTGDSVLDIVIATFNSTVLAINGDNYERIWNFSMPMSETYATPAPGFFNDDDVPDFLVIFNHGPTFPVYYYSEVTVLDGKTGEPLIQPFIRHSGSIQSSPLTVSIEGTGQDMFLYFASDCLNHEGKSTKFSFTKSTFQSSKSRADFCKVRFNTSSYSRLYAMSYSTGSPGSIVYNSLSHTSDEYRHSVNTSVLADNFLKKFPGTAEYVINRRILTEDEQNCVDRKMEVEGDRMNIDSKYYGMDHDAYEQVVEDECKGNNSDSLKKAEEILLTDPLKMYPFNLHMGEMTVYRLHLTCACAQPPCARVLPFRQQAWPSYLGARANSLYVHRKWGKKI
ncbi:uncharacterized protein [Antedon mediterranea]|uniref:uncharacterized protein isoform X2 n=1 Tax=Antedon mediterranea TaxID=105859 RepID=UPI003AF5A5D7